MNASVAGKTRGSNKQTALIKRHHNRLTGKRNENELIVNNVKTKRLIDTGSEISTISETFWKSISPRPEIHVTEELEIKCANGRTLPYHTFVELTIGVPSLKGVQVSSLFLVAPVTEYNKEVPFIVGTNVI